MLKKKKKKEEDKKNHFDSGVFKFSGATTVSKRSSVPVFVCIVQYDEYAWLSVSVCVCVHVYEDTQ